MGPCYFNKTRKQKTETKAGWARSVLKNRSEIRMLSIVMHCFAMVRFATAETHNANEPQDPRTRHRCIKLQ